MSKERNDQGNDKEVIFRKEVILMVMRVNTVRSTKRKKQRDQ